MATNYDEVECSQCGYERAEYYLDTGNKYLRVTCYRCGWDYFKFAEVDEDLTKAMGKEWDYFKVDADGKVAFQTIESPGFGAYRIVIGNQYFFGTFHEPTAKNDIHKLISDMATKGDIDTAKSYVAIWDDELKEARIVYGETSWPYVPSRDI